MEPQTARIVETNSSEFAAAVLASLPNWKYEPARKDGLSVRQIVPERRIAAVTVVAVQ
jgi:hypothetical protein